MQCTKLAACLLYHLLVQVFRCVCIICSFRCSPGVFVCVSFARSGVHQVCFVQELFEKVNKAYEFLCSRAKITEGPNPQNIVLILKAQSILFSRYRDGELLQCILAVCVCVLVYISIQLCLESFTFCLPVFCIHSIS